MGRPWQVLIVEDDPATREFLAQSIRVDARLALAGCVHKDAGGPDVAAAVLTVKAGGSPISPAIARRMLARWRGARRGDAPPAPPEAAGPRLSQRETEVLELIARGYSYAETARRQGVSLHTVQAHIKNLYGKLSVHSKNEAVYQATRLGLLTRPPR